jgi:hypothetical protein
MLFPRSMPGNYPGLARSIPGIPLFMRVLGINGVFHDPAAALIVDGQRLVVGTRRVAHPVRPEGPWVSLRTQRGNADDALLRRLYGPDWHARLAAPAGRRRRHAAVVAAGLGALTLAAVPRRGARIAAALAALAGLGWLAGTAEFAAARLRAAPGARHELSPLLVTSALIPRSRSGTGCWAGGTAGARSRGRTVRRPATVWRPAFGVTPGNTKEDAWT